MATSHDMTWKWPGSGVGDPVLGADLMVVVGEEESFELT
jgi:hypothetical protein